MPSANQIAKQELVKSLAGDFKNVQGAILTKWSGITVEEVTALRKELRAQDVRFQVIKNKLAMRAIEATSLEGLKPSLKGPTALAFTEKDPVAMAKTLAAYAKKTEDRLSIEAGILAGRVLTKSDVIALANVPSREVLLGRLVGALQSPYAGLVFTLSGVLRKLVYALDAVRRQKEEKGS